MNNNSDWEMLKATIEDTGAPPEKYQEAKDNLQLFFHLLSTEPAFAEKAFNA